MNRIVQTMLATAALTVFVSTAGAQERRDSDWYHRDRDDQYQGDRWRNRIFWQVRQDLDHVQTTSWPDGRDQYRIARVKQELNELQEGLANNRFDQRALDEVIGAFRRVVADNRLAPRDREILNDDLRRLADYREHHEGWGRR